jgi:hypothetical protein
MRRIHYISFLTFMIFFPLYSLAQADGPSGTLQPGARIDYRFDYRGDGTQIRIALDSSDSQWLSLSIYTPSQAETLRRGGTVDPVGRGTPSRDHNLFWAGAFRVPGVYHVFVASRGNAPIPYVLDISGDGVSGAAPIVPVVATPPPANRVVSDKGQNTLVVNLPPGAGTNALRLPMPRVPSNCTHANQIPSVIGSSVKLCPNETYAPLRVAGSNIGVFADDAHTAVVSSSGRQFAITMEGANNWVEGVTIQARAEPQDASAWLCLYDECVFPTYPLTTLRGGVRYGGGILLKGSGSTVHGVTVRGGVIGIATVEGRGNAIVDNTLNDLGWGSFNITSTNSYYIGNVLNRNNRACTTPDGRKFLHGCETSGWVCLDCQQNIIATNHCELSGNCFYLSGERGMDSNDNKLLANYCSGASDNCFELTFSQRNVLQDNVGTMDPKTSTPCKYPFWVGGSIVFFQNNQWQCNIDPDDAFNQSRDSTIVATNIINLDVAGVPPSALLPPAFKPQPTPKQNTPVAQSTATPQGNAGSLGWAAAFAGAAKQ